jgi:murein L,D-transpeptidase YafK
MNIPILVLVTLVAGAAAWAYWPSPKLETGAKADRIIVRKSARTLELLAHGQVLRSYRVSLGGHPVGHKRKEGDQRTPEGAYTIDYRNAASAFHRSLHISYPSPGDKAAASAANVSPGGMIMVHGLPNRFGWWGRFHRLRDWTAGCVAVTNPEMEEIWRAVEDGTPIELLP